MSISRRTAVAGLAVLPLVPPLSGARAQAAFPSKPMTFIVPFPAGGPADIFGRPMAHGMSTRLGQPVIVENKSGAAGVTGVDFVAKAGTDAHVMGMMSASAGAIMQHLMPKMPYDPNKDIAPVTLMVRVQEILVVNNKTGITDFKGFVEAAKARPGKITSGSAGTGGITHLAIELLKREAGLDILHVPYRGAAPATNDLLAGTVDSTLLDISVSLPHLRAGTVKALAVTSDTRAPLLPDVPTMRELGLPKVNSDNWYALISPGESPKANRQKVYEAAVATLKSKEVVDTFAAVGGLVVAGTPEELAAFLREESLKWGAVIKSANVKLEQSMSLPIERGLAKTFAGHIHWRACGSGPVVMVSHINQQSSALMIELLQALGTHFRAIAIDYPSHGHSDHIDWQPAIEDYARAVVDTMNDRGVTTAFALGEAVGAAVSIALAKGWPNRIKKIVAINTPYFTDAANARNDIADIAKVRPSDPTGFPSPRTIEFLLANDPEHAPMQPTQSWMDRINTAQLEIGRDRWQAMQALAQFDPVAGLKAVRCPVLMLYGEHFIYGRHRALMQAACPGARIETVTGGRFCMSWERATDIADHARAFLL